VSVRVSDSAELFSSILSLTCTIFGRLDIVIIKCEICTSSVCNHYSSSFLSQQIYMLHLIDGFSTTLVQRIDMRYQCLHHC